jgi:hypothetical protein
MPRRFARLDKTAIDRLEAERNKTLPPGSRHHVYWCAIFNGKPCDCGQSDRRRRRGRPRPGQGGSSVSAGQKAEFEDA